MKDFSGHTAPKVFKSTSHFVRVYLKDLAKQAELVNAGAHSTRDGSLIAISVPTSVAPKMTITRKDGTVEESGDEPFPAHFQLLDSSGHNFTVPVKDEQGHGVWSNVIFFHDSPAIDNVKPLDDIRDMAPGRVVSTHWAEGLHSNKPIEEKLKITQEEHISYNHESKAGDLVKHLAIK